MQSIFEKICKKLNIGELTEEPKPLTGGLTHKMYSLFTTKGKFAVKLLNPYIMQRPSAINNFSTAEKLELLLQEHNIPILPAISFNNKKMQLMDDNYFYLFYWFDGTPVKENKIQKFHCEEIGKVLSRIHNVDVKYEKTSPPEIHINWEFYLNKLRTVNFKLFELLNTALPQIYEIQNTGNIAIKNLPHISTICHNDLDCKNVLWNKNDYRIIDLECLCYSNPVLELYETALSWSGFYINNINLELFKAMINEYLKQSSFSQINWEVIYHSNYARLEWLEYNLKRVLGIDCDTDEKDIGIKETRNTIRNILYYYNSKNIILKSLIHL